MYKTSENIYNFDGQADDLHDKEQDGVASTGKASHWKRNGEDGEN